MTTEPELKAIIEALPKLSAEQLVTLIFRCKVEMSRHANRHTPETNALTFAQTLTSSAE